MNKWTEFWDMHSGGGRKLRWEEIYIEAPRAEAERIFEALFDRDPNNVTCDCCGGDYSISEYDSLDEATKYERKDVLLEEYVKYTPRVKVVTRADIPKELLTSEADLI